jgi:uncharacterized membrane protein HdeD (DUF308 family)
MPQELQEIYDIRPDISQAPPHFVSLPVGREDACCDERGRQRSFSPRGTGQDEAGSGDVQPDYDSLHQRLDTLYRKGLTGQWRAYAINGASSVLAGLISLILPVLFDSQALAYAGGILVMYGALTLAFTLSAPPRAGFGILLLLSLLHLPAGIYLMLEVFTEPISFIWVFSAYFAATGITTLLFAVSCRRRHCAHCEWLAVSGVLKLELALIALSGLPVGFIWSLTIFLGLDFITHGSALLAVALVSNEDDGLRPGA